MTSPQDALPDPSAHGNNPAELRAPEAADGAHAHDFDVQKQVHQQIRNDPDYDDWEYGTEPLPHEAWVEKKVV
jgi:hypothetical protein